MTEFDDFRIGDARRFVENIEDVLAHTPPGRTVPGLDAIEGTDASGTVYCTVRLDGRPGQIRITDGWWKAIGARGIAGAVLQAYRFAGDKATFARLVLKRHGRISRSMPELHDIDSYGSSYPTGHSDAGDLDALRVRIDQAAAKIAAAMRLSELVNDSELREISGSRRMFIVMVRGAVIEGARVNEFGLRPEDASDLAADALEALLAARPSYASLGER
ncbi:hypothetical protein [Krasilnikovia sp. MM14-A1004]|uniref:hypothetical protein n=1 Tax=Krasilnikovia sp. MM14-A1004 TaxID=3373541 RepID=UPI00399C7D78